MYKTEKTVTLLKTIAIIAGLAILLWSLGLPALRFADAANITSVSDVLSDSAPSAPSNHTIQFITPSGVGAGDTIVIDFQGNFNPDALDESDFDFASTSDYTLASSPSGQTWGVSTDATSVTFTSGTAVLGPNATVTIQMGTNATFGATGNTQIVNPASEGSKEINFQVGDNDSGWTRVVILAGVEVSAAVDTIFTFTVAGLPANTTFSGTATTTGGTGSTTIEFGTLEAGVPTTTAQNLTVSTNAANGYNVTVQLDQALQSSTGAIIDGFEDGSDTNSPAVWDEPGATVGQPLTYGHWGFTSTDTDTIRDGADEFAAGEYAAASTTPRVVMSHTGPANGSGASGEAIVGYKVEISSLQEAGDDYSATLTYVATPTF